MLFINFAAVSVHTKLSNVKQLKFPKLRGTKLGSTVGAVQPGCILVDLRSRTVMLVSLHALNSNVAPQNQEHLSDAVTTSPVLLLSRPGVLLTCCLFHFLVWQKQHSTGRKLFASKLELHLRKKLVSEVLHLVLKLMRFGK